MSQTDFDIGPLTWVKAEIDAALARATESLDEALAQPGQREPLRFAQSHVHQASGALSIVGLDGVSQFSEAIDKLLSALAGSEDTPPSESLSLARRSLAVLANYLNELLAGAPHKPLRLFPTYRELVVARGEEAPQASELFFPDLSARPALGQAEIIDPAAAAHELRLLRARFEKGLLLWIRQPNSNAGAEEMLRAVQRIEQIQSQPATRAFWWAAIAFFEALAQQLMPVERATQRLCRRIDTQMRRLIEGSQVVAERLVRDVLYFVATVNAATPHSRAVRQVYKLDDALPSPDQEVSDTLRQPLVLRVREALENAKDAWNRFSAGAAVALPLFQEQLAELRTRISPMRLPDLDRLLSSMTRIGDFLRGDPLRHNEAMSMEIATGLLVVEQAVESPAYDKQLLQRQVEVLATIYDIRSKGGRPPAMDDALFGEASQRAQEKLFFNQLAREILTNLGQIEQTLDAFFRNSAQRDPLATLSNPLKQIEGALSMLGETDGAQLVRDSAAQVQQFISATEPPSREACDEVAHKLSALGFYVEALKNGPAKLQHFLDPSSAFAAEEAKEAATGTVEAQLLRESRETRNLAEALKETPQDSQLRDQLVSNLEAIREDAQLVADSTLEQQTKEAIASLKSGAEVSAAQIQEVLSTVAQPAAPQPSEEAARLMQVSTDELDAELLAIFLEEAQEVVETLRSHREIAAGQPHDQEALTTLRRGFHTLKGSSRMVGLEAFSDAAKHVEMAMNRWLQLEKDASPELLALIDESIALFSAWVDQLMAGGSAWRDANSLTQHADRLLASLDASPEGAAPPRIPPSPERAVAEVPATAQTGMDVDLDFDLAEEPDSTSSADTAVMTLGGEDLPHDVPQTFEASLEETSMELPALGSLGVDLPLSDDDVGTDDASLSEIDLTATLMEGDFDRLSSGEKELAELDLTATLMEGLSPADEHLLDDRNFTDLTTTNLTATELDRHTTDLTTTDLDLNLGEIHETELDLTATSVAGSPFTESLSEPLIIDEALEEPVIAVSPGDEGVEEYEGDESAITTDESTDAEDSSEEASSQPAAVDQAPAAEVLAIEPPVQASEPAGTSRAAEEDLVEVPIEDGDEDIELPVINLSTLNPDEPTPDSVAERVAELAPAESVQDSEVSVGDNVLSRGLYDLYLGESAQHLATLRNDQHLLDNNPLHVPSMEAVRAAHTLAGISGTARFESLYGLAKALEHALHRLHEVQIAPERAQAAVFGATLVRLEAMQAEIVRQQMPLDTPELIDQLNTLRPRFPEPVVDQVPEAVPELVEAEEADDADDPYHGVVDELDEQLLPIFFEEADELSVDVGNALRQLRSEPTNPEPRNALARVMHTIKGSARMAGAMRLGEYVHGLESRLEAAGNAPTSALVEELEIGFDHVGAMLEALRNPGAALAAPPAPLPTDGTAEIEPAAGTEAGSPAAAQTPSAEPVRATAPATPSDANIPAALRPLPQVAEEGEATQQQGVRALVRVRADMIDRFVNEAGEISIARTRVEGEMRTLRRSLLDLTENVIRLRNQLREVEISAEGQMQSRIAAAESLHANFDPLEFDRFTRLQELTRMMAESVGDVTTIQQNLLRNLDGADSALHAQGRLSRDLQQALMGVRMVPFNEVADRLYRVVRQTARELGKRANLDIVGGSIEIDRGVLDRMIAPLEHLLRNALAHGIEMPDERTAAGKSETGQITLKLTQLSNEIALEMSDDGRGLNFERIAARGRKVGLIGENEQVSENRLTQLIFEPGFSTAETVTGVAGRGVGMDVVKNEALAVGGRIDVYSTPGNGARFLIHLPLTLAVTQALLVRAAGRTYAIPSNMVEQAIEVKEDVLAEIRQRGYAEWKDQQYPLRYLPRLLGDTETQPEQARFHWILLLRAGNDSLGLYIDALAGNQEIVVKNAGPQFVRLQGYTGATVLPDGEISLILNPVVMAGRSGVGSLDQDMMQQVAVATDEAYVPTIMVVDDSLTVRKITSRLLEREGYRVVTAKDGVDALEQLTEMIPDVMLSDIEMPRMDGFDLARNVRGDERLKDIPIIMITSRMADKHRAYAAEIGVNHYLGKPYQEEQLLELIAAFIFARKKQ